MHIEHPNHYPLAAAARRRWRGLVTTALWLCVALLASHAFAQKRGASKLPAPDRIVSDYLKAVGGKKRQSAVRDAIYEWSVKQSVDAGAGADGATNVNDATNVNSATNGVMSGNRVRSFEKYPVSSRTDILLAGVESNAAANVRSAWERAPDGKLRTLTDAEANVAKLLSALNAGRLADYKKQDVLARTVGLEIVNGEPAYRVEFSRRNGARLGFYFAVNGKLLRRVDDELRGLTINYADYRATSDGMIEPHSLEIKQRGMELLRLALQSVRYNSGLADSLFEPPGDGTLDLAELLRAVGRNQDELDRRVAEYTFTRKQTEREIDDQGTVKKEKTLVHEIYPVADGGRVLKLISEDGVPLSPERRAKEDQRVADELEKMERENVKRKAKVERKEAERARKQGETGAGEDGDDDVGIGVFLRACEFVSPRRESFRGRDAIVFDFRPRAGFKPANRGEALVSKLAGVAWIDPVDRQVMRLEARLSEGFKVGGGLLASVRSGSAFSFEQTRLADGVWLPRFSQINASAKVFLFAGFRIDATREYSDYKRFSTSADDVKLDQPKAP